jgi:hypothetical protein
MMGGSVRSWRTRVLLFSWIVAPLIVLWPAENAVAATSATLSPSAGSYRSGQDVEVSVGANSLFAPGSRIIIIECADPDGSSANLPTSLSSCDEDTVEADTVLVQANGSFTEHTFTLYSLPNSILGEGPTWQPVCNQTHQCLLYIGENQDDFTQPKIFSQPFAITPTASTSTSAPTASASSRSSTSTIPAGVSLTPSTLAFTGADPLMPWLVAIGLCLTVSGVVGQRVWRRRRS